MWGTETTLSVSGPVTALWEILVWWKKIPLQRQPIAVDIYITFTSGLVKTWNNLSNRSGLECCVHVSVLWQMCLIIREGKTILRYWTKVHASAACMQMFNSSIRLTNKQWFCTTTPPPPLSQIHPVCLPAQPRQHIHHQGNTGTSHARNSFLVSRISSYSIFNCLHFGGIFILRTRNRSSSPTHHCFTKCMTGTC